MDGEIISTPIGRRSWLGGVIAGLWGLVQGKAPTAPNDVPIVGEWAHSLCTVPEPTLLWVEAICEEGPTFGTLPRLPLKSGDKSTCWEFPDVQVHKSYSILGYRILDIEENVLKEGYLSFPYRFIPFSGESFTIGWDPIFAWSLKNHWGDWGQS